MGHHPPWELQASGHAAGRRSVIFTASCWSVIRAYVCVRNEHLVPHGVHRVCEEFLVRKNMGERAAGGGKPSYQNKPNRSKFYNAKRRGQLRNCIRLACWFRV